MKKLLIAVITLGEAALSPLSEPPPSWTEQVTNPDPTHDSYAIAVWGALKDYDWPDLIR